MESFGLNASSVELTDVPTSEATCNVTLFKSFQWPKTPVGTFAKVPCPASVVGVSLKPGDVKHFCGLDGQWALQVDFSACFPEDQPQSHFGNIQLVIYMVGFTSSLVAMTVALIIFLYCRCLKCMRNKLHMQLILTFVLKNIFWIIVRFTLENLSNDLVVCKVVIVTFNYLSQATFFWMLVEGLYLHTMIVWTLLLVQLKFWHYCFIGWGIPFVITAMWILASALNDETTTVCWLPEKVWKLDYILLVPIFIVLLINLMFLVSIVWVLITKLRSSYPGQNGLYKKATKATLILFPLLGMTYLLFLWAPKENNFFWYISAIMHSTQGLFVSVVYCFLNSEVRKVLKKYIKRWKDHKNPTGRLDSGQSSRKLPRKSIKMNGIFGFGGKKTTTAVKEEQAQKPSSLKLSSSKSSLRTCPYNQMGCKKKITPKKKVSFHLEPINSCRNNNEFYKMKKYSSKKSVPVEEDFEINLESLSARSLPFFHVGYSSARNS